VAYSKNVIQCHSSPRGVAFTIRLKGLICPVFSVWVPSLSQRVPVSGRLKLALTLPSLQCPRVTTQT